MVTRFGMDGDLGQMVYEPKRQSFLGDSPFSTQAKSYSEDTGREIDVAIRNLVKGAYTHAIDVLVKRKSELEAGAEMLLEKETLTPDEYAPLRPMAGSDRGESRRDAREARRCRVIDFTINCPALDPVASLDRRAARSKPRIVHRQ